MPSGLAPSTDRDQPLARLGEFSLTDRLTDQLARQSSMYTNAQWLPIGWVCSAASKWGRPLANSVAPCCPTGNPGGERAQWDSLGLVCEAPKASAPSQLASSARRVSGSMSRSRPHSVQYTHSSFPVWARSLSVTGSIMRNFEIDKTPCPASPHLARPSRAVPRLALPGLATPWQSTKYPCLA